MPCNDGTPVVAGYYRMLDAERVKQTDHVADQVQRGILLDLRRGIGLRVPVERRSARNRACPAQWRGNRPGQSNPFLYEWPTDIPANPHCRDCEGRGFVYDPVYAHLCRCRYPKPEQGSEKV